MVVADFNCTTAKTKR